jgi:hypothetical protein
MGAETKIVRKLPHQTNDLKFRALAFMAGLLILGGVYRHQSESRRKLVLRTEVELKAEGEHLVRLIHSSSYHSPQQLESLFEETRRRSHLEISWIQLRDQSGRIQARAGLPIQAEFIHKPKQLRVAGTQQLSVVDHPEGAVMIARFPVRWPVAIGRPSFYTVANHATLAAYSEAGVVEIAARLGQIRSGSWSHARFNLTPRVSLIAALSCQRPIFISALYYDESNS